MFNLEPDHCRLCGISTNCIVAIESNLASQINILLHINVNINNDEDKLPKSICRDCISSVDIYWTFYQRVHNVQRELTERYCMISFADNTLSDESRSVNIRIRGKKLVNDKVFTTSSMQRNAVKLKVGSKNHQTKGKEFAIDEIFDPDETWSEYPWRCFTCQSNFNDVESYNQHPCFKKHKRYFCVDCTKAFIIYNQLITHIKEFHWHRLKAHLLCQCDVCKRWLISQEEQELHRQQEHPYAKERMEMDMPAHYSFTCQVCGKIYANRKTLRQHALLHSDKLSHVCGTCGERFQYPAGLYYHRAKCHAEEMLHCDQCGKEFPTKPLLRSHMVSHSKERPFRCDICHKTFKTEYMAKIHKSRHTDKKPHICESCGKVFKCRTNLINHRYLHKKERIHKCQICEKAFKTKTHLISHERQHTGEQPFSCSICLRKFTCNGNRVKHMRRIHKICTIEPKVAGDKPEQMQGKFVESILESVTTIMY